jgi:hypothetical protein
MPSKIHQTQQFSLEVFMLKGIPRGRNVSNELVPNGPSQGQTGLCERRPTLGG